MANYKAVVNGNWSNLATWQDDSSGSYVASTVLPGAADVVYWNNFTVAIDQDVTVSQIRSNSTTGVSAGGTGTVSTSRTINADLFHGTGTLITVSATSPSVVNINGNMPGTAAGGNSRGVNITGTATVNYVGNVVSSTGIVTGTRAIIVGAGATLNLTGDAYAGNNNFNSGLGSVNSVDGIHLDNSATLTMVGNVYGGLSGGGNQGIRLLGTSQTISITGSVNGGTGASVASPNPGVVLNGAAVFSITGNLTAGQNGPAIYGPTATTPVQLFGNVTNGNNGNMAVIAPLFFLDATVTQWEFRKSNLTTNTLYTPGVATGFPTESNVRNGITYGPTNTLTGTCFVPSASTVSLGVPVDNTVGTAQLTADDFLNGITASTSPLAVRLQNVVTTDVLGAQIAAYSP